MTGRKGRVVRRPDGSVRYESRAEQSHTIDHINVKEKDRFMRGEKVRGRSVAVLTPRHHPLLSHLTMPPLLLLCRADRKSVV